MSRQRKVGVRARIDEIVQAAERAGTDKLSEKEAIAYHAALLTFLVQSGGVDGLRQAQRPPATVDLSLVEALGHGKLQAWTKKALAPKLAARAAEKLFDELLGLEPSIIDAIAELLDEPRFPPSN